MTKFLKFQNLALITLFFTILITLNSCGIYRKTDAREIPTNANERIIKNVIFLQQIAKKLLKNAKKQQIFKFTYIYYAFINEKNNKRKKHE